LGFSEEVQLLVDLVERLGLDEGVAACRGA
jgi:hypothetical protein